MGNWNQAGEGMQGYSYSIFSIVAIAIHLIINFKLLVGRGLGTAHGMRYRDFLFGILFYYVADGAWGVFAGLGWTNAWYFDTILFFLSLVAFVVAWSRFAVVYLDLGKWPAKILAWSGYAILSVNIVLLAANFFCNCFFHIDAQGKYVTGPARDPAIGILVVYLAVTAAFVTAKAVCSRDFVRRRSMMVLLFCVSIALSIVLQIIWPLTPFTSLGCLVSNCFFHVFVVQDELAEKHAAELENALERARAADKARSMFFSIVSHDIRTPLNAIIGYSELIQHGIKSKEEADEAIGAIHANGTTLLQLVNDVLDLAKMDSNKMKLHPEPMRLSRLTHDVLASFRLAASSKGIELVDRTAHVPTVMLDAHRFRQILFNLVGNAVKFTEHGRVSVEAFYAGERLEVSVSDTGCGIASDMLTNIFDPFVQVQDPSHAVDRTGGTGLGLSICRSLVKVMGGEITVASEPGKGTTFKVSIPGVAACGEPPPPAETAKAGDGPESKKIPGRVLVVDDSSVNRAVLTAQLKKAGVASIDQACDGAEAFLMLEAADKDGRAYDTVFSDFWMPKLNGLEFVEKIRADSRFHELPVFSVTADTELCGDSRHKLFNGVILKPLTYDKLLKALGTGPEAAV